MTKFVELDALAKKLADELCEKINQQVKEIDVPEMPYKGQYTLETIIEILEDRV